MQQAGIESGHLEAPDIAILELGGAGLIRLRSLLAPEPLKKAIGRCGIHLPMQGNESLGQNPRVLCLRPGEWLLISETCQSDDLLQRLKQALEPDPHSQNESRQTALLENSDGLTIFRLSGKAAPWLLNKISSVDFLAAAAKGPHALRTRMGQIAVVVSCHPVNDASSEFVFDLIFDRSVAAYLWQLLVTSVPHAQELAAEFGGAKQ